MENLSSNVSMLCVYEDALKVQIEKEAENLKSLQRQIDEVSRAESDVTYEQASLSHDVHLSRDKMACMRSQVAQYEIDIRTLVQHLTATKQSMILKKLDREHLKEKVKRASGRMRDHAKMAAQKAMNSALGSNLQRTRKRVEQLEALRAGLAANPTLPLQLEASIQATEDQRAQLRREQGQLERQAENMRVEIEKAKAKMSQMEKDIEETQLCNTLQLDDMQQQLEDLERKKQMWEEFTSTLQQMESESTV